MDRSIMTTDEFSLVDLCIPFLYRVGTVVFGLVSIAAAILYAKQDSLLYFPEIGGIPRRPSQNPRRYRSPAEHGIPFETHMIRCEDGVTIHSWLLLHPDSQRKRNPTIVFFHGNAGNIGLRLPNAIQMYRDLNANVLQVEYRGYGDSDSVSPSEAGLKLDAEAAFRFISTHPAIDTSRIFVFGRSLGGAVGFHLAHYAENLSMPLAGVIVENTFLSISHMVDHLMPYLAYLKPLVLRLKWESYKIVPHLSVPTLYLAGSADQLVPHSHMLELYKASRKASRCARMHIIVGGTHNETWVQGGREYWERIRSFLAEAFAIQTSGSTRSMSSMDDVSIDDFTNGAASIGMGSVEEAKVIPAMPTTLVGMAIQSVVSGKPNKTSKKEM
jgi:abhydrolase domain-containing protein 13